MKNVTVSWTNPGTRTAPDGSKIPLQPSEIDHCEVFLAAKPTDGSAPQFASVGKVPSPGTSLLIPDVTDGDYIARVVVVDNQRVPQSSANADVDFSIVTLAALLPPPDPVQNATVSLSDPS